MASYFSPYLIFVAFIHNGIAIKFHSTRFSCEDFSLGHDQDVQTHTETQHGKSHINHQKIQSQYIFHFKIDYDLYISTPRVSDITLIIHRYISRRY